MSLSSEKMLVDLFISWLAEGGSPWGNVQVATEFFYQRGRTDVVAYTEDRTVIAVEAKLTDWRFALHQAYRNRCFAHQSYVLFPKETAVRAARYDGEFDRRRVGICYVESGGIVVLRPASDSTPIEPWLSQRARQYIDATGTLA
jgi:hypothetical protein